ncbi:MAG: hypothetical protein M1476_01430 [Candidatus Thermoplasmatota archaeon]|nr:hypothetical protein [Candidatus Thermoplasmatota archaeon]
MIEVDELRLLEEIRRLDAERIGIKELRKNNSELYGYYLDWLIRKENKLVRKYIRKYDKWPVLPETIILPSRIDRFVPCSIQ